MAGEREGGGMLLEFPDGGNSNSNSNSNLVSLVLFSLSKTDFDAFIFRVGKNGGEGGRGSGVL